MTAAAAAGELIHTPQASAQAADHGGPHSRPAEGGEGGEGGESGQVQAASSDTELLVVLAQMQGHLLVAEDLLRRGDPKGAEPHVGHPVDELYATLQPAIQEHRLPAFLDSLESLRQHVRLTPGAPGTAQKLAKAQQVIAAASQALAPTLSNQPTLVLLVCRQLAESAAAEYAGAVAGDRIVETIEYQDARGFLLQADRLLQQASRATPAATGRLAGAQARISALLKGFPTSQPPARSILSVSQVNSLVQTL